MKATRVTVPWREGLHLRPASRVVRLAQSFRCTLRLKAGERVADARSIFQILLLSATLGTSLVIEADGKDESEAVQAVAELISSEGSDGSSSSGFHVE